MTPRERAKHLRTTVAPYVPWAALVTAFTLGGAWFKQSNAVESLRKEVAAIQSDTTTVRRTELNEILIELRAIRAQGDKTALRLQTMYCAGKPPGCE